jgi:signal transduction histidine kinase/CheY-like chemotaxis protein
VNPSSDFPADPDAPPPPRWRAISLRSYLVALMLLATVPIAALMSILILDDVRAAEQKLQQDLQRHAGALALAIERELAFSIEALQAIGQAEALRHWGAQADPPPGPAWPRLRPSWSRLVLMDPTGRALYDSAGEPAAPVGDGAGLARVLQSRAAVVSSLLDEPRSHAPGTLVQQPVLIDGELRYVLAAWIDARHWRELLQRAGAPPEGFSALLDGNRRVIAATPAGESLAPQLPGWTTATAGVASEELANGSAQVAWQRLPPSDWGVAVGQSTAAVDAAQRNTILASIATAAGCLLLGVALALGVARRITQPLRALAHGSLVDTPGAGIAPAQPAAPQRLPVREIALLQQAMQRAAREQQRSRAQLQTQADELQALFASSPIGLALARDRDCTEVLHNAEMERLIGPPRVADAAAGDHPGPVQVLYRGTPLQPADWPLQRAAASGRPVPPIELELVAAAGGAPRHAIAHAVPLLDADGAARGAIAALTDITGRKAAEAQIAEVDRRLHESMRLMELAQEAGHVGFFVYRFDIARASWTPGQARLFGLAPQPFDGTLDDWLQRIHEEDRPAVEAALRQMLATGQRHERIEFRVPSDDAEPAPPRWLSSRLQASYDPQGRPLQVVGVTVDVSDQKAAEEAHRALNEREQRARRAAEAASRAKDEFLAMFGHELRNPLSGIASAIEVLNQAEAGSPLAVSAREVIGRQTRHLTHLMDDLLDVGRVVSGKVLLTKRPFDLAALVRRLLDGLKITGEASGHALRANLEPVWVKADATRIAQVATNLLTNALKYTPPGRGIEVVVKPVRGEHGDEALLQLRDEGDGIPPELLPKIFDLFVQGERTLDRRAGGLGIGLTLVRRLVEQHGGRVAAESSPAGSVFSVWLAAVPAHPEAPPKGVLPEPKRRRVLVIEDNADAANSLRALLELDGHSVELAADGASGLDALLTSRPDAAVVDIGLPGMNGFDVAKRSRGAGYAGMLVALTGYGQGTDIKRALQAGFDAHLVKPLDAERLRRLLVDGPTFG